MERIEGEGWRGYREKVGEDIERRLEGIKGDVTRPGRGRVNKGETVTKKVTNKTGDNEGEEEKEGEEIYHDAIGSKKAEQKKILL